VTNLGKKTPGGEPKMVRPGNSKRGKKGKNGSERIRKKGKHVIDPNHLLTYWRQTQGGERRKENINQGLEDCHAEEKRNVFLEDSKEGRGAKPGTPRNQNGKNPKEVPSHP